MFRHRNIGSIIMAVLLAEVVVFVVVAEWIGFGPALLLTMASSVLGSVTLRRSGIAALAGLRGMPRDGFAREGVFIDGVLAAVGALLLILPGFISDLVGLVLIAPSGRQWLMRRLRLAADVPKRATRVGSQTIELGAEDWTRLDNMRSR